MAEHLESAFSAPESATQTAASPRSGMIAFKAKLMRSVATRGAAEASNLSG